MPKQQRIGDLEIEHDLLFQRRAWVAQRIAWGLMVLVIIGALLGLFGSGILSHSTAQTADAALQVEYENLARFDSATTLQLTLGATSSNNDTVTIWIDKAYLNDFVISYINPEPLDVKSSGPRLVYTFGVANPNQPVQITLDLRPQRTGLLTGAVGLLNGPTLTLRQFVYP